MHVAKTDLNKEYIHIKISKVTFGNNNVYNKVEIFFVVIANLTEEKQIIVKTKLQKLLQ